MYRTIITLLLVLSVSGCSRLRYKVDCYPVSSEDAKTAYKKAHGVLTIGAQVAYLQRFKDSLAEYKDCIREYATFKIHVVAALVNEKERKEYIDTRLSTIDGLFRPIEQAIDASLELAETVRSKSRSWESASIALPFDIRNELDSLEANLAKSDPPLQPDFDKLGRSIGQMTSLRGFEEFSANNLDDLQELRTEVEQTQKNLEEIVDEKEKLAYAKKSISSIGKKMVAYSTDNVRELGSYADNLERSGGDTVKRPYSVYQELSDPFLQYIAENPHGWKNITNSARAMGEGDNEYVIVFDSRLDGRWKSVTVDPTRVIDARLRTSRQLARLALTATGVASGLASPSDFTSNTPTPQTSDKTTKRLAAAKSIAKAKQAKAQIKKLGAVAGTCLLASDDNATGVIDLMIRELESLPDPDEGEPKTGDQS